MGARHAMDEGMPHSAYYHRRYEGYMETVVTDAKGKRCIQRVYTGEYYHQDVTDKRRCVNRAVYFALYALSALLFIGMSSQSVASNFAIHVQLISFMALSAMLMMLANLIVYSASPRRMILWQYYAGPVRVKRWSRVAAWLMATQALAVIVFALSHHKSGLNEAFINAFGLLAASLAMFAINRMETQMAYTKTLSESAFVRGGYYIDS